MASVRLQHEGALPLRLRLLEELCWILRELIIQAALVEFGTLVARQIRCCASAARAAGLDLLGDLASFDHRLPWLWALAPALGLVVVRAAFGPALMRLFHQTVHLVVHAVVMHAVISELMKVAVVRPVVHAVVVMTMVTMVMFMVLFVHVLLEGRQSKTWNAENTRSRDQVTQSFGHSHANSDHECQCQSNGEFGQLHT